jgi:hypothetical protein
VKHLRVFTLMALVQFISYTNLTVNIRAIAAGNIPLAMVTDCLAAGIGYLIVRRIAKDDDSLATLFGLMLGGSLAALVGITFTRG